MRAADGDRKMQQHRIDNVANEDYTPSALSAGYSIHHDQGLDRAVADVAAAYKLCLANKDATQVAYEMMARKAISSMDAFDYWDSILGETASEDETQRAAAMRRQREHNRNLALGQIWTGPTSRTDAANGTVFGAFQAVTE